ncbi:transcription termination factor 5, mitochondrial [Culex pipiens pallens]|uniref:transcription termination factor 5, mitochondrial n=1 Tax=Culex pipiens pallens TaxID=42434 RepID=UPI0019536252|nr:transcription termination factor 5, mitochondrial [Culex pipiens pallens]
MLRLKVLARKCTQLERFYCTVNKFNTLNEAAKFLSPLLDVKEPTMYRYLTKHDFLLELERDDIRRKLDYFRYLRASNEEILQQPNLLMVHLITLENRTTILRECGFVESLNLAALSKYITLVRQKVRALKKNLLIPADLDMVEQLRKQFELDVLPVGLKSSDDLHVQPLREQFISEFLRQRLDLSDVELKRLWQSYSKIKHKSFGHTQRVVDILQYDYKFSREKIVGNLYLLHADPENLLRYPTVVPSIGGMDIKELMVKQPKVMMVPCDKVQQLLGVLRSHEIDESGILKYSAILTLAPDTIQARIIQIKKTKEFEVLLKHPRITKLIAYQTKAAIRLDFLQQLKVRCASLNVLASHSQGFEKYVRDGCDRTKGKDTAHFFSQIFAQKSDEVFTHLKRHPNWFHIPTVQIQETMDYLRAQQYTLEDIGENIQIVLYPLSRISAKLDKLHECARTGRPHDELGIELVGVSASQMLSLCLYTMELDFHFTGDGVWPEQVQLNDASTSTNIELPKTLNKDYKYGKKPAVKVGL